MGANFAGPNGDLNGSVKLFSVDLVQQTPSSSAHGRDIAVDRAWARTLGIHGAKGARRVGHMYLVPRAEYLRLVKLQADPETSPCFRRTENFDREAVAVPA